MDGHVQVSRLCESIRCELESRGIASRAIENATYSIETLSQAYASPIPELDWRAAYRLTVAEEKVAKFLHSKIDRWAGYENILQALYYDRGGDCPERKIIQVFVCKLRKKLKRFHAPYSVEALPGRGYKMVRKPIPAPVAAALQAVAA